MFLIPLHRHWLTAVFAYVQIWLLIIIVIHFSCYVYVSLECKCEYSWMKFNFLLSPFFVFLFYQNKNNSHPWWLLRLWDPEIEQILPCRSMLDVCPKKSMKGASKQVITNEWCILFFCFPCLLHCFGQSLQLWGWMQNAVARYTILPNLIKFQLSGRHCTMSRQWLDSQRLWETIKHKGTEASTLCDYYIRALCALSTIDNVQTMTLTARCFLSNSLWKT